MQELLEQIAEANFYAAADTAKKLYTLQQLPEKYLRTTDGKPFNDKQLELLSLGVSPENASFLLITKHHVTATKTLINSGINAVKINQFFKDIQEYNDPFPILDLISLGSDIESSLTVTNYDQKPTAGIKAAYEGFIAHQTQTISLNHSSPASLLASSKSFKEVLNDKNATEAKPCETQQHEAASANIP